MKKVIRLSFLLALVICFSCEEKGWIVNCSDCIATEPESVRLKIKLDNIHRSVILNVYEGELEDSILYTSWEVLNIIEYELNLSLNKKYTVTATYNIKGIKYVAVDSAIPRVKYTKDECDNPCYYVYDRIIDVRLKYTAD